MDIKSIYDAAFRPYGRVVDIDFKALQDAILARPVIEPNTVVYEPSIKEFEALPLFDTLQKEVYGELPIELGHCSGWNEQLNALEYHRSSEINMGATDFILLVGLEKDIINDTYDTSLVEAFSVPAGVAVELYATTLHYAPCRKGEEFRIGVALPKGTNEPLAHSHEMTGESRLLTAKNKWLIAHAESGLSATGAHIGLIGENIRI